VGDRYGNPVPTGTAVYFSTSGGLIQGSSTTDDHGRASVDLITAAPLPNDAPAYSDSAGLARISAQTMDEYQLPIVCSALAVAFTGHTELITSPAPRDSFDIPAGGAQDFTVTVWDREHHNPLIKGSTVTFAATLGTISGQSSFVLPDTRDKQYTSFTFRLENGSLGPAIVGPNRVRMRLGPSAVSQGSGVEARYASAGTSGPTGRFSVSAATLAKVMVTVTSGNGNASVTVPGVLQGP
jgi:hypothetical protein